MNDIEKSNETENWKKNYRNTMFQKNVIPFIKKNNNITYL